MFTGAEQTDFIGSSSISTNRVTIIKCLYNLIAFLSNIKTA